MSSFLNGNTLSTLTGIFQKHFEQFSTGINNYLTVIKSPIQQINTNINSDNILPGYGADEFNSTSITYIPQSGQFPAMIIYPSTMQSKQFTELKFSLSQNEIIVKTQEAAFNYIREGKNEMVIVNNLNYTINPYPQIQNFFGSKYYYFKCVATQ